MTETCGDMQDYQVNWDFIQSCFFCLTILTTIGDISTRNTTSNKDLKRLRQLCGLNLRRSAVLFDIRDGGDTLHVVCPGGRGRPHGGVHRVHLAGQQGESEGPGGETELPQTNVNILEAKTSHGVDSSVAQLRLGRNDCFMSKVFRNECVTP